MAGPRPSGLDALVDATPTDRDRMVDFLRVASIVAVVFGHWFIGVIWRHGGKIGTVSAIGLTGWLWIATWFLQVIPLFFFVGGFSNLVSYRSYRRPGRSVAAFLSSRAERLLRPTAVFLGVWLVIEVALHLLDTGGTGWLRGVRPPGATVPFGPLWFLGVYLGVVLLSPLTIWLHRRFGWWVPFAMAAGAIAVDALRFGADAGAIGWANVALVFLLPHQLGYLYADGRLASLPRWAFVAMAAAGLLAMIALTNLYRAFPGIGVYPRSLLGTDVERITNTNPPTVMMLAMAIWSIGAVMLLRPLLLRWLQRRRAWKAVVFGNGIVMTLFLWHMTAYLIAVLLLWPLGLGHQGDTTASWWIERPVWEAVPALLLVGLVAAVGRFERPGPSRRRPGSEPVPSPVSLSLPGGGLAVPSPPP